MLIPLIWAVYNLVSFILVGADKRAAKKGRRRMPEKAMIALSFTGAGAGVLFSFYLFRHKTKHRKLMALVWIGAVLTHAALIYLTVHANF